MKKSNKNKFVEKCPTCKSTNIVSSNDGSYWREYCYDCGKIITKKTKIHNK